MSYREDPIQQLAGVAWPAEDTVTCTRAIYTRTWWFNPLTSPPYVDDRYITVLVRAAEPEASDAGVQIGDLLILKAGGTTLESYAIDTITARDGGTTLEWRFQQYIAGGGGAETTKPDRFEVRAASDNALLARAGISDPPLTYQLNDIDGGTPPQFNNYQHSFT